MAKPLIDLYGFSVNFQVDLGNGPIPFSTAAGNSADYIESISIRIGILENIRIEVKLAPPVADGIRLLKSGVCGLGYSLNKTDSTKSPVAVGTQVNQNGNQFSLNKMMIQISYGGLVSPWFKAYIMMPEFEIGDEGMEITMHGFGMLFDETQKTAIFAGQFTPYDAVNKILSDQNVVPQFDKKAGEVLKNGKKISVIDGKTHQEQLNSILKANNCKFVYIGNTQGGPKGKQNIRIFHVEDTRDTNKALASFVAFKNINPQKRVFPILNISGPLTNVAIGTALTKNSGHNFNRGEKKYKSSVISYGDDRTTKITSTDGSAPGESSPSLRNEQAETSGPDSSDTSVGSLISTITRDGSNMEERAKGAIYDWMEKAYELNIVVPCIPDLLPANLVHVNIADIKALNNYFDLFAVEHTIGNGGAETRLNLKAMAGLAASAAQKINKITGSFAATASSLGKTTTKTPTSSGVNN